VVIDDGICYFFNANHGLRKRSAYLRNGAGKGKRIPRGSRHHWGGYIRIPTRIEIRVRVIRVRDNKELMRDTVQCVGEKRKYLGWGENNSQRFYDDILACIPRLKEKIVDDLFMVYPLATQ
jgi:hypothetical protein